MKRQEREALKVASHVRSLVVCSVLTASLAAYGDELDPMSVRVSAAGDKFDGVSQVTAAFNYMKLEWLEANRFEFAIGSITSSEGNSAFASFGPIWRMPTINDHYFFEFGISPTVISNTRFNGRDVGGHFHFTSFVSAGARLGRNIVLSARVQHLSNGGLQDTNPGMDMFGLELSFKLQD